MRTDSPALEVPHLAKPGARGEGAPGKPLTEAGEIAAQEGGKQSSHLRWVAGLPGGASGQEPACQSGDVRDRRRQRSKTSETRVGSQGVCDLQELKGGVSGISGFSKVACVAGCPGAPFPLPPKLQGRGCRRGGMERPRRCGLGGVEALRRGQGPLGAPAGGSGLTTLSRQAFSRCSWSRASS